MSQTAVAGNGQYAQVNGVKMFYQEYGANLTKLSLANPAPEDPGHDAEMEF